MLAFAPRSSKRHLKPSGPPLRARGRADEVLTSGGLRGDVSRQALPFTLSSGPRHHREPIVRTDGRPDLELGEHSRVCSVEPPNSDPGTGTLRGGDIRYWRIVSIDWIVFRRWSIGFDRIDIEHLGASGA